MYLSGMLYTCTNTCTTYLKEKERQEKAVGQRQKKDEMGADKE